MNIKDYLEQKRIAVDRFLDEVTPPAVTPPTTLHESMRYSLMAGGKRVRPILTIAAAEALGQTPPGLMAVACSLELIHTYSLIHDDLPSMDNDDARRGRPTCHKKFGEGVAILAGDALLALAFEVLAREITPPEVAVACLATLGTAAGATALVGGQCDDIGKELACGSREMLESIHNRKTGALFLASLRLGGLVAGASETELEALRNFGANLGLAFQITDDLLDIREDRRSGAVKKKKGDWGKLTFPNLIGEKQSRQEVDRLVAAACEALAPFGNNARSLRALATFVSERV
jgi:geranylgeranyl diphosphate synthase type II